MEQQTSLSLWESPTWRGNLPSKGLMIRSAWMMASFQLPGSSYTITTVMWCWEIKSAISISLQPWWTTRRIRMSMRCRRGFITCPERCSCKTKAVALTWWEVLLITQERAHQVAQAIMVVSTVGTSVNSRLMGFKSERYSRRQLKGHIVSPNPKRGTAVVGLYHKLHISSKRQLIRKV